MSNTIFFKNAQTYKLSNTIALDEVKLKEHPFGSCTTQQMVSLGWVPPIEGLDELIHKQEDNYLFCLKKQEKILPATAVNKILNDKINTIKMTDGRRVGHKERQTIKDEVIFSMLPHAFVTDSLHYGYINIELGILVVNESSENAADTFVSFLRETLGGLPCTLFQSHCQPAFLLTDWLARKEAIDSSWELLPSVQMTQTSDSSVKVSFKNVDLDGEEIETVLEHDGMVSQIAFYWKERMEGVINDKAQIKQIKFSDLVVESIDSDDKQEQLSASFLLMANEINTFLLDCERLFGVGAGAGNYGKS